eukprot:GHVS01082271.1.p2 GENE.GHVS01082271.1~~GHVS01082271.1.p2  ORF type:complete len:423 (-),score=52.81 GHVS01082271.1:1575-2843(-)
MPSRKCVWEESVADCFLESCEELLHFSTRRDLERRVRSGTGTEEKGRSGCGHSHEAPAVEEAPHVHFDGVQVDSAPQLDPAKLVPPAYVFKKDESDVIGGILDDCVSREGLTKMAGEVAESAGAIYDRVVEKGNKDGLSLGQEKEEEMIRKDILKETLIRQIQRRVHQQMLSKQNMDSREGGLLANPSGYKYGPLDNLRPETISNLMNIGFAVQEDFLGPQSRKSVYEECELLEFDGKFNEVFQQSQREPTRTDFMCWIRPADLERDKFRGLMRLFKLMSALAFELNAKANLFLQAAGTFQLSHYAPGSFYHKHMDGGFADSRNNGRKITCMYYPNPPDWKQSDGGVLRMYPRRDRKHQEIHTTESDELEEMDHQNFVDIPPTADALLLFRSRDMPHEVLVSHRKRFAVTLWLCGPAGPGDG